MHIKSVNVYDDTAQSLRDIRDEFGNSTHDDEDLNHVNAQVGEELILLAICD